MTSLVAVSNHFFLDSISTGSDPSLKYGGTDVVAGQFGSWTPIGAEQTASGYQVAWKVSDADQYSVWTTDSNGNFISTSAILSGSSSALKSFETSFHQDLNGDGAIGASAASSITFDSGNKHLSAVEMYQNIFNILTHNVSPTSLLSDLQTHGIGHSNVADLAEDQMPTPPFAGSDSHFIALKMDHYQMPATAQLEQHLHPIVLIG